MVSSVRDGGRKYTVDKKWSILEVKEMKLGKVRKIELAMWGTLVVLGLICGITHGTVIGLISAVLMLALMIGIIIFASLFRRCPHCGRFLRYYGKFCPQCGNELDW